MSDVDDVYEKNLGALRELAAAGFAVVVFTPDELGSYDAADLESDLFSRGNDILADYRDDEDEE